MAVPAQTQNKTDEFSSRYAELIESSYDCIDRIVINAYNPLLQQAGGLRCWRRQWKGSDEGLETTQLMRIAGRYGKRVRAYAEAHKIPVVECDGEVRKHELAEEHLPPDATFQGVFLILVSRFSAPIWEVQSSKEGKVLNLVRRYAFVKQYWFFEPCPKSRTLGRSGPVLLRRYPLHKNSAELAARRRVRKRDISFGPRTADGVAAWDTFMTLAATARQLGVSFYAYIYDRVAATYAMPGLADIIRPRAPAFHPLPCGQAA